MLFCHSACIGATLPSKDIWTLSKGSGYSTVAG